MRAIVAALPRGTHRGLRRRTIGAGAVAGAALTAYAAWEARQYTLRQVTVPVLPPGADAAPGAAPQ